MEDNRFDHESNEYMNEQADTAKESYTENAATGAENYGTSGSSTADAANNSYTADNSYTAGSAYTADSTGSNAGSAGYGSYQYTNQNDNTGRSTYQSAYQGDYRSSASGGNGSRKSKKSGAGWRKALLAVLLAAVFGICAGAGAYSISRAAGNTNKAQARLTIAEEENTEDSSQDKTAEEPAAEQDAGSKETTEPAAKPEKATENTEEAAAEENAAAEETGTTETDAEKEAAKARLQGSKDTDVQLTTGDKKVIVTDVTEVVEETMPSIVSVYNNYTMQYMDWWGQSYSQESQATGSGIIIAATDDELLIVTNNHVVDGEESLDVQFIDETTAEAQIKGTDEDNDLAVIAVKLDDIDAATMDAITVATLGNSDNLKIGEPVVAIGNALGFGQSVTQGIVSALNRQIGTGEEDAKTYIQTDAAINPGNSGGALVDMNGHVIGINSNKIGDTKVEGMCYAIPTARAIPIIEELMTQSTKIKVDAEKQGYLGIKGISVTSQVASAYDKPRGVYIAELIEGGGAADSELEKGDIIVSINKATVNDMEDLQKQLQYYEAGEEVTVVVKRNSGSGEYEEKEITIKLGSKATIETEEQQNSQNGQNGNGSSQQPGSGQQDGYSQGGMNEFPWSQFFGY